MKRLLSLVITLFVSSAALAQEHDHMAMLRAYLAAHSSHGPVIPQPTTIDPTAAKTFNIVARSFQFDITPTTFVVDQGDVVTINLSVPAGDQAVSHGLLMETYLEDGISVLRGKSTQIIFTATTAGHFQFACAVPDCGTGHSSMGGLFIVNAVVAQAPAITSINPTSGSTAGGTSVTITGTSFVSGATVKLGGTAATNVNVNSSTTITATTPAHAAGAVDVVVTNPDAQVGTLAGGFTYVTPVPTVTSITPDIGPTSGNTLVTIRGTNLLGAVAVKIGGLAATNVTVVDATTITAMTPLGPANEQVSQKKDVVVFFPNDATATLPNAFQYTKPALSVTQVTPSSAPPAGGTKVAIGGAGFTTALVSSITIGGTPATNLQVIDAVTMTATVPAHAVGGVDIVVNVGGTSVTVKNAFAYLNNEPRHRPVKH